MSGAQPRMTAHLAVGVGSAPVLLQEHPQPLGGRLELVLGVDGTKDRILLDPRVERRDQSLERGVAADGVEERRALDGSLEPDGLWARRRRHRAIVTEPMSAGAAARFPRSRSGAAG